MTVGELTFNYRYSHGQRMEQQHSEHIYRSQRFPVSLGATIYSEYGTPVMGQIENISLTGLLLKADEDDAPVIKDADINLELYVPEGEGVKSYKIPMRVARFNKQLVGLQVDDYDDKTVDAMRSVMLFAVKGNSS